ncbi:ubiquitin-protein ligase-like protein [Westerdykella ornata]|uniref:Ubiquitin-protein ligase-like protein n=1 Tax=Westerdykella ornata TaxID=318751 RepID=A0A6A6JG68_WESOR|nr:ubiquitin-protein ligase-like protein [Westerdykella ornata]KAF2275541.1 ubiquitin-protein ligase-like protein [Westerdykella ornata]
MDQFVFRSSLTNATAYLPSPADLLLVFPRLLYRAGLVPDHFDGLVAKIRSGGPNIAGPTAANVTNATLLSSTLANTANTFVQQSTAAATAGATSPQSDTYDMILAFKHVGTLFEYLATKYAIATMATAILLNRTQFYASSRIPLSFRKLHVRFVLYIVPILLFLHRAQSLLRAVRCQTSPSWSTIQYGSPGAYLDTDFAGEGGFLFRMSSALLLQEPLGTSCAAVGMLPTEPNLTRASGSLRLIWPFFVSLAFSAFVETLSCALQGRRPLHETGMTLFEHSLAFAEAEALVTKPLSIDWAQLWKPRNVPAPDGTVVPLPRSQLLNMANVPPEVLLLSIISSFSHLTSHVLAMLGLRAKLRLITTSIWASAYMSALTWMFLRAGNLPFQGLQKGVVRFHAMCAMGFLPHIFILIGILACGTIYGLAFILTVLSPPPGQAPASSLQERFWVAYRNLHANIHLSAITPITISMQDDFYTAIIKIGFTILTAASEAVYLNEGTKVRVESMSWLEKKKLSEYLARRRRFRQSLVPVPPELLRDTMGEGIEAVDIPGTNAASTGNPSSGYARERKTRQNNDRLAAHKSAVGPDGGVGARQREGRFLLAYQFLNGICRLLLAIQARAMFAVLRSLRIRYRPAWLRRLAGPGPVDETGQKALSSKIPPWARSSQPWSWVDELMQEHPLEDLDVEDYVREGLRRTGTYDDWGAEHGEELMDHYLYSWWKQGGQWGDVDTSGDYEPEVNDEDEDDTTSVVSMSTNASEWSDISDGQRTPTQAHFTSTRESTPQPAMLDISRLAHLLDPKTREDREEARLLSRSLQSPGIMTRSRFRREKEKEEMRLLTSSRLPINLATDAHMSDEDEEKLLEQFILDRRHVAGSNRADGGAGSSTWDSGAEGMGSEGPQCVVCQLAPRTILVWPCGCLSLCDECRVGLAAKNYTTCVCCRANVVAYSRLYVP